MEEIARNFHHLHRQWIGSNPSTCTDLALNSLVGPKVERNGVKGRPRLDIPEDVLRSSIIGPFPGPNSLWHIDGHHSSFLWFMD